MEWHSFADLTTWGNAVKNLPGSIQFNLTGTYLGITQNTKNSADFSVSCQVGPQAPAPTDPGYNILSITVNCLLIFYP